MFPKNRINIIYRLLCLISFIIVIWLINSQTTLIVIFIVYIFFALSERSFRNIELIIITGICLWISYLLENYLLFQLLNLHRNTNVYQLEIYNMLGNDLVKNKI